MTPEQLSRLRTHDPDFDNPDPQPHPMPISRGQWYLEWVLATAMGVLAGAAIALGIALALRA